METQDLQLMIGELYCERRLLISDNDSLLAENANCADVITTQQKQIMEMADQIVELEDKLEKADNLAKKGKGRSHE